MLLPPHHGREQHPQKESSNVRPHGYTTCRTAPERIKAGQELADEPQSQKDHCGDRQRKNNNECEDARPGVEENVRAHHTGDGSAGAHGWDVGMEIEQHVQQSGAEPAREVKKEIQEVAEEILDIVPEDPKKEHVSGDVQEAGMEKHAGDQWQKGDLEAGVAGEECRDAGGDHGVRKKMGFKGAVRKSSLKAELVDEDHDVGEDQRDIDEGIGPRWVEIFERDEHGIRSAAE